MKKILASLASVLCATLFLQTGGALGGEGSLFYDGFENGGRGWDLEAGWTLAEDGADPVLKGSGHSWAALREGSWGNLAFSARFRLSVGAIHFNLRRNFIPGGQDRYFVGIIRSRVYLHRQAGNSFAELAGAELDLDDGWHRIDIRAWEGRLNVLVDGVLYIIHEDKAVLAPGHVALETLENSVCLVDDVRIAEAGPGDLAADWKSAMTAVSPELIVPDETHGGNLVLSGSEALLIENTAWLQQGHITVKDRAKLVIRDAALILGRGSEPTVHTYINVEKNATLSIERSTIVPDRTGGLVVVRNSGTLSMTGSPTQIHLLEMYRGGRLTMTDSEMVGPIGGLLQVTGGDSRVARSTLGALALAVPKNASCTVSGLASGTHLDAWDVRDLIPKAGYGLVLEDVTILRDDLQPGPYERGWLFFADAGARLEVSDSELRKVFFRLDHEKAAFDGLRIGVPCSVSFRKIRLDNVVMRGQWPFEIFDSTLSVSNSDYLFLQPSGTSKITLTDSHMCEFIPRNFKGTITFENCSWTIAGEIIGGAAYHSLSNNFTMKGSLTLGSELRQSLQWRDAKVTREYVASVADAEGCPLEGFTVKVDGRSYTTDGSGEVRFSLVHEEDSYRKARLLEVFSGAEAVARKQVDFFTATPIRIRVD